MNVVDLMRICSHLEEVPSKWIAHFTVQGTDHVESASRSRHVVEVSGEKQRNLFLMQGKQKICFYFLHDLSPFQEGSLINKVIGSPVGRKLVDIRPLGKDIDKSFCGP